MRVSEKRMPAAVVGVVFAALLVVVMTLGSHSAVADPSGPVPNPGHAWTEIEGHGDDADGVYVSTQNNEAFEIRVNDARALRLEPDATSPNVIGGHSDNTVTSGAWGATISGGGASTFGNRVTDMLGTIGGGLNNQAGDATGATDQAPANTVGGGSGNVASGSFFSAEMWWGGATVGGGYGNQATAFSSTIAGGWQNTASATQDTVGGGTENTASGGGSTVGGGALNTASGGVSTVGGGSSNDASGGYATVGGGQNSDASGGYSTIAGGWVNEASGGNATVGGGVQNDATGFSATVGGGRNNDAAADYATIAGGGPSDTGNPSTTNNVVTDDYGTIGGGGNNVAGDVGTAADQEQFATVAGGESNEASGWAATVGGGYQNTATSSLATIGGGQGNDVTTNDSATVGGGKDNTASGRFATVPGGLLNTAAGYSSFAAGRQANANNPGCFVWGDSSTTAVNCNTNDRFMVQAGGGIDMFTNSAMTTGMYMNNGDSSWTGVSDRDLKENFTPVDGQAVVAALADVPITTWNMKGQDESIRHMGPVAQDFYEAFGLGYDEVHISTVDPDGVALAAIQGLYELSQEQAERINELEARVTALEGGAPVERGSESLLSSLMPTGWLLLAGLFVVSGLVVVQMRLRGVGR